MCQIDHLLTSTRAQSEIIETTSSVDLVTGIIFSANSEVTSEINNTSPIVEIDHVITLTDITSTSSSINGISPSSEQVISTTQATPVATGHYS